MKWSAALSDALWSGSIASIMTTAVLAACGRKERGDASAGLNGPSQWVWGRAAARQRRFSLRHTVVGYLIHHAMSIFWAMLFERVRNKRTPGAPAILGAAAATSAAACLVDFRVMPARLSPGFERQLSRTSLFATYAVFALALAAAATMARK